MRRLSRSLIPVLLAPLALMGCDPHFTAKPQERIALSTSDAVMSYRFTKGGSQLISSDQHKLRRLLAQVGAGPQDRIVLSLPAGATAAQTKAREAHLRGLLAPSGAQITLIGDAPGRRVSVEDQGMIRIVQAHRMTIHCPENEGLPSGCSQSRNLAVMLADPNDVMFPRELTQRGAKPRLPRGAEAGVPAAGTTTTRGSGRPGDGL